MILFRLSREKYKNDLSGTGAKLNGGRWNSPGTAMLYTSENRALTVLEVVVHISHGPVPTDYFLTTLFVPDDCPVSIFDATTFPTDWNKMGMEGLTQHEGNVFVKGRQFLGLKIPSAIVKGDFNWLLNPLHPAFPQVRILGNEPFQFDSRLFV